MVYVYNIMPLSPFYHKDTIRDHRLVVRRLPLEGKLTAMPRLGKRPAATTDEVDRRRFPHSSNIIS